MKAPTTWIVVADGGRACIYSTHGKEELKTVPGGEMEGETRQNRELRTDRPGETKDRMGYAQRAMDPDVEPQRHAQQMFAKHIGQFLYEGLHQGHKYEQLVLVAPDRFLGMLNAELDKTVEKLVIARLHKDLTHESARSVLKRVAEVTPLQEPEPAPLPDRFAAGSPRAASNQ